MIDEICQKGASIVDKMVVTRSIEIIFFTLKAIN